MNAVTIGAVEQLQKIEELRQQAEAHYHDYQKTLAELASVASNSISNGTTFDAKPAKGRPGRPKAEPKAKVESKAKPAKGRPGRPKADGAADGRRRGNSMSLREACWDVLSRNSNGLKVSELKETIEKEGKWTSTSDDIGAQIQNTLHNLKNKEGKLGRDDDRRYHILKGKTLA